ncbi:hypothetical protein SAMN04489727_1698 [Amycolatopsis tolypomycina]|uniref:Uncharacterized protein n=1 Tax=Amycolatopsis tolypomycina TaxID=208445 RepID=A0A1H4JAD7_9PSEU|nr:hypothetical protein [Amycolatopsis tolypomycina]SEB43270.1 hypothetical protein SAMN04489727_1698 [Amycolatopsis tolypomycina]
MTEAPSTPFELPEVPAGPTQGASPHPDVHADAVDPAPELDDSLLIGASIFEGSTSVNRHVNISVPADADDMTIAEQLLLSTLAVATAYRPGVAHALTAVLGTPEVLESLR